MRPNILGSVSDEQEPNKQEAGYSGGQLEVDAAACPVVAIPAKSLRSVLYNLLSNALKYRHPDRPPHVRLTCRTQEGYWC